MSPIELVAAAIVFAAVVYTSYLSKRGGGPGKPGQLHHGPFPWWMGALFLPIALGPAVGWSLGHRDGIVSTVLLSAIGTLGFVYSFAEAAFVRGTYDEQGIVFFTPWTGTKREAWKDLVSIRLAGGNGWFLLTFRSGRKIRLSVFLDGYRAALEAANRNRASPLAVKPPD